MKKLKEVSEYVADKLIELNKDTIQEVVYDVYEPTVYQRSPEPFSFKNAWDKEVKSSRQTVEIKMYYAPEKMGEHTSIYGEDIRDILADIIYQGLAGNSPFNNGGAWTRPRDAFSKLGDKLGKSELDNLIKEGMNQAGLQII